MAGGGLYAAERLGKLKNLPGIGWKKDLERELSTFPYE